MTIAIATPLEPELVDRIRAAVPHETVLVEPGLLPVPRYPSDHRGDPAFVRAPADEERFWSMLERADVLYGIPGDTPAGLAEAVRRIPGLRWVQATAAGAGEQVRAAQLGDALQRVVVTSAAGAHGGMLAEFAFYGMLALRKNAARLERARRQRLWDHFALGELAGDTIAIVGMGSIGRAIAARARAFEMRVIGVTRHGAPLAEADEVVSTARLRDAAATAGVLAVTLPATDLTRGLVSAQIIASLRSDAIVVNVGRGAVLDQTALTEALQAGAIAGAVIDVTDPEPPAPDDPLWTLPNVVLSTHTAALSVRENARIVEMFCDNLQRFARGEALRSVVNTREFY